MFACTNSTLWLKMFFGTESDNIPYILSFYFKPNTLLNMAEFMIHTFVASFTSRIVPFTFCIGMQLELCIYHLKHLICVITMQSFDILEVSGYAE
jgi:hypothetical protein